jgi:hypothetical protein
MTVISLYFTCPMSRAPSHLKQRQTRGSWAPLWADSRLLFRVHSLQMDRDCVLVLPGREVAWFDMGHWTPIPSTTSLTVLDLVTKTNRLLLVEFVMRYQREAYKVTGLVSSKEISELPPHWQPPLPDVLICW